MADEAGKTSTQAWMECTKEELCDAIEELSRDLAAARRIVQSLAKVLEKVQGDLKWIAMTHDLPEVTVAALGEVIATICDPELGEPERAVDAEASRGND